MRQIQIKTRESAVHAPHPDVPSVRQAGSELPQVRTREPAVCDIPVDAAPAPRVRSEPPKVKTRDVSSVHPPAHRAAEPSSNSQKPPDRLSIKTREAYMQSQPASMPEQPPQALVQGRQEFMQERGRSAAMKRAEAQRVTDSAGTGHPIRNGGETTPPAPARRGYAGGQGKYAPAQAVRNPVGPGEADPPVCAR